MLLGEIWAGHTGLNKCTEENGFYMDYCNMGYEAVSYICVEHGQSEEEALYEAEVEEYGVIDGMAVKRASNINGYVHVR